MNTTSFYDKRNPRYVILSTPGVRLNVAKQREFQPIDVSTISQCLHFKRNNERSFRIRNWVMNNHNSMLVPFDRLKETLKVQKLLSDEKAGNDTGEAV